MLSPLAVVTPADWTQLGVGLASVLVLLFVVRDFLKFMGNHMTGVTRALDHLVQAAEAHAKEAERLALKVEEHLERHDHPPRPRRRSA